MSTKVVNNFDCNQQQQLVLMFLSPVECTLPAASTRMARPKTRDLKIDHTRISEHLAVGALPQTFTLRAIPGQLQ